MCLGADDLRPSLEVLARNPHKDFDPAEERKAFRNPDLRPTGAHVLCFTGHRFSGFFSVQGATSDGHDYRHTALLAGITPAAGGLKCMKSGCVIGVDGDRLGAGRLVCPPPLDKLFLRVLEHADKVWEHLDGYGDCFRSREGLLTRAMRATVHPQFHMGNPVELPKQRAYIFRLVAAYPADFLHRLSS